MHCIYKTPIQATILQIFGHQRILCIDSTHGTSSDDFTLVTIVVVDDFGEGYPVGWCLSNREDPFVLEHFLRPMKERTGSITPAWFMSDDADQFYNAWRSVFGPVPNFYALDMLTEPGGRICHALIKDKDTQVIVYHNLRMLMEEPDVHKFETLLTKTKQQLYKQMLLQQTLANTSQRLTYRENNSGQDATENDHS